MVEPRVKSRPGEFKAALPGAKVSKDTESRLISYCERTGKSMSEVIREAVERFLLEVQPR